MKLSNAQKMHSIKLALAAIETTLALSRTQGTTLVSENLLCIAGQELLDILEAEEPDITPQKLTQWTMDELLRMASEL